MPVRVRVLEGARAGAQGAGAPQGGATPQGGTTPPTGPGAATAPGTPPTAAAAPPAQQAPTTPPIAPELAIAKEAMYEGEPILAVAADSEELAAAAIEAIVVDFEPLDFVVDPLDSLRPGGPNGRTEGNVFVGPEIKTIKWTAEQHASAVAGKFPVDAEAGVTTVWGDIDKGFKEADLVVEHTQYQQSTSHQPLESRTAMAYWQNGRVFLHGSTQSVSRTVASVAGWLGVPQKDVVVISEYLRRRLRQQDPGRADDGDSGAAVQEAEWPAGDDAHLARGRNLHRPHASGVPGVGEDGLQERWPRHRD